MSNTVLRIHPAIGMSRVGNSDEYILSPETAAGVTDVNGQTGGLAINPTTNALINDTDLRDANGALKRQAQRYRIYQYLSPESAQSYPYQGEVAEIVIGSALNNSVVKDIVWQVHLANKKANWCIIPEQGPTTKQGKPTGETSGLNAYGNGGMPYPRNPDFGSQKPSEGPDNTSSNTWPSTIPAQECLNVLSDNKRLTELVVDAGPRTIKGTDSARINFDASTTPSFYQPASGTCAGSIVALPNYPVSFPNMHFNKLNIPSGTDVTQLGALETDCQGRLIVIGGQGAACGLFKDDKTPYPLGNDIDNDGWFDDTADGPVQAIILLENGDEIVLENTAWAVSTDPSYAPQIRNVITVWDEVYDTWIRKLGLDTNIYNGTENESAPTNFVTSYKPSFDDDILPLFSAAHLSQFIGALNQTAIGAHARLNNVSADDNPSDYLQVQTFIRSPYASDDELDIGAPRMPLALGDTGASFLTLTRTQFFFMNQWFNKNYSANVEKPLTAGEQIDKNVLANCLGGRFSPGIDLTFIVRDVNLYNTNWTQADIGPFRINYTPLNYSQASKTNPFLSIGYVPLNSNHHNVEPGDLCKFMSLPWHTDYNSCATHLPSPNPGSNYDTLTEDDMLTNINITTFWSWPAQRPVSIYNYDDFKNNGYNLARINQRYSVRGEGTQAIAGPDGSISPVQSVGRYQERVNIVRKWPEIGTVVQSKNINGYESDKPKDIFLEVASQLDNSGNKVATWPQQLTDQVQVISDKD
ncbi:LodA/GoxA family CTQ-dependent oxidase [Sessilibacter sp. MAH1]